MRPLRALAIYLITVFFGGALVAPCVFWLIQMFGTSLPHLAASPFHRFVNRSFLGLALLGIWPLARSFGFRGLNDLGLVSPAQQWKKLGIGFALGFLLLAVVALVALGAGARVVPENVPHLLQRLLGVSLTAIVVAVLEELLFRGVLFGGLRKRFNWVAALVLSSM